MNKVICIGRLGRDPVIRTTSRGTAVASFSVACERDYNGQKFTDWINVVAWGKIAEAAGNMLRKGSEALISGRLGTRKYTGRDNQTHYITEVTADFVGASIVEFSANTQNQKGDFSQFGEQEPDSGNPGSPEKAMAGAPQEDIPF